MSCDVACMYVHVCMDVCLYLFTCMYIYVCMYTYMHVSICTVVHLRGESKNYKKKWEGGGSTISKFCSYALWEPEI